MSAAKITVIVPAYNVAEYLPKCIESILHQTHPYLQIILIDDGSTDSSGEICDLYAEKDDRIEVFHTDNRGLVAARKLGLRNAEGQYIGFVDGDDYIEADMFEILLKEISKSDADFVHTGFFQEKQGKSEEILRFEEGIFELGNIREREDFLISRLLAAENNCRMSYSIWSKLYKKELIQNIYFRLKDEQQYGEDLYSLCLCILQSRRIQFSRYALYHYVIRENSMSHFKNAEYLLKKIRLYVNLAESIYYFDRQVYSDLEEAICDFIARRNVELVEEVNDSVKISRFHYGNIDSLIGKKVVIYGAGAVGRDYYEQFCRYRKIEIAAWLDSNWRKINLDYMEVAGTDRLAECEFDLIIIAVREEGAALDIKNKLRGLGQPEEKIVWDKPKDIFDEFLWKRKGMEDEEADSAEMC